MADDVTAGRLDTAKVLRVAHHAYRRWFWRIAVTAAVIFGAAAVLTATVDVAIHYLKEVGPGFIQAALRAYVLVGRFGGVLALVFYAGFLDLYVGDALYEGRARSFGSVLHALPYRRLIVADVLLAVAVEIGWLLFVVPGLLVFTLFALVGPLIIIEGHDVRSAFHRSRHLVARRLWLVVGLVTLPAFVEGLIERAIHGVFGLEHFWGYVLVSAAVGSVVGAYCGLMEVILARELSQRYPGTGDQR